MARLKEKEVSRIRAEHILVIEPSADMRHALQDNLAAQGYQAIATNSMKAACLLLQAARVEMVLVNVSAFPAASIRDLGRALRNQRDVRLLATVSQVTMALDPLDAGPGSAGDQLAAPGEHRTTVLLRLSGPAQLTLGLENIHPN